MSEPVEVVRELYAAVAAGDREAIAARLAPHVRWEGRERGPRWRRRRPSCAGSQDATGSLLLNGRKLPPRELSRAQPGDHLRFGSVECVACDPSDFWRAILTW